MVATIVTAPPAVDEITLEGKKIQMWNMDLPIDEVTLDPSNPRIANTVGATITDAGSALQEKLEAVLWEDPDVHDLYRQVLINEGLIERIIVREDRRIVEGNCRTVVYRKLRQKHPKEDRWNQIPARVLPEKMAERDVAILLGEMHVAGKNTWSPFEKAGHVYRLHKDFALTYDEIAHRLRMSKSKINQLIRAFDVMRNKFLRNYPSPANIKKFSYFEELYKKPPLRDWLARDPTAEDQFIEWVGSEKLAEGKNVRDLPAIVESPDALTAMTTHGFAMAKRVLERDDPTVSSRFFRIMRETTKELEQARLDDIQRVRKDENPAAKEIVLQLNEALTRFMELCGLDAH